MDWTHTYPLNDLIEHNLGEVDGDYSCPCDPRIDVEIGLVVHNSLDRRECFEINNDKEK